mgnify:CR=1 FL=1
MSEKSNAHFTYYFNAANQFITVDKRPKIGKMEHKRKKK